MPQLPWSSLPPDRDHFARPPREYGILPFWFLNGELDPEEMRYQLREFRDKGMPGIILHGRFGLEMPYIGERYLERVRLAVEEGEKLGLKTWIYDEMNWPSGTADKRVLAERPELAQRYLECVSFTIRGPWFSCLTGEDSRYLDFERSTPVAAFAVSSEGEVVDLTPNLSFGDVIPWEVPEGSWRLMYIVEKRVDYYIDALDPEATAEFLRQGYEPYARVAGEWMAGQIPGFYTDEPAMHYFVTGGDNPIVPWTKEMFRRFYERNGYNLRLRLPDLFFDVRPDSARVRYDFYTTLTEFYSDAYYRQIHEWCQQHDVLFTGHLLYEEWLRRMIRVEGNPFSHYRHMDVIGVDHLYPFIGNRDRPDEHVAMKLGSSAAHHLGSERLLCESFGGIFMDATMQRMKWITDWEYVLGVNLLNPHGFHYTLEGPRKRDWPPSMFYQYPWWHYYGEFSDYISRLSYLLTGGHHVAKVAVLWPINAMFATYTPQSRNSLGERIEQDFNALTDYLLRLHYDFDYLDEDILADAELDGSTIRVRDESFELLVLPPMTHIQLGTLERMEQFVAQGGRLLGAVFLPDRAFGPDGLVDISQRIEALFGVDPGESQRDFRSHTGMTPVERDHPGGGKSLFLRSYALARRLPRRLQEALGVPGQPESAFFHVESDGDRSRYYFLQSEGGREEITGEVEAEWQAAAEGLQAALDRMISPDVTANNPEIFYLHRVKEGKDLYFFVNPTYASQRARVTLSGEGHPLLWDPSTGTERPIAPTRVVNGRTAFDLELAPTGSLFVVVENSPAPSGGRIVETNLVVEGIEGERIRAYGRRAEGQVTVERDGRQVRLALQKEAPADPLVLDGEWEFEAHDDNALVIGEWLSIAEQAGQASPGYVGMEVDPHDWLPMVPGAWSYQLPTEPSAPYPIPVWYRIDFEAAYRPERAALIIDGFAGADWQLYVNEAAVHSTPLRSSIDGQMQEVDITGHLREGRNLIALRLVVTNATDGLLDLVKIVGSFGVAEGAAGRYRIVAPPERVEAASWTGQGYPFYSGRATYRRRFELPETFAGERLFIEPEMQDDVLELIVNGQSAGVRLWAPYGIEVTELLHPGVNEVELRVANTLINLLEAQPRPSGLAGAPRLVPYHHFTFDLSTETER